MPDSHTNFAVSTVETAPSPAASGTSLVVSSGQGSRFPTPPFNATISPVGVQPTPANAEIVRVTAVSTDTLTIARAQESTSARVVVTGDQITAPVTAKTLTDVENIEPVYYKDEPFVIASGDVFTVPTLAWTDATVWGDLPFSNYEPVADRAFWPGTTTEIYEDPFILDSPYLADLGGNPATLLWTDAPRCPQTVSTLLIIGV